jgi:hypothetical protein
MKRIGSGSSLLGRDDVREVSLELVNGSDKTCGQIWAHNHTQAGLRLFIIFSLVPKQIIRIGIPFVKI